MKKAIRFGLSGLSLVIIVAAFAVLWASYYPAPESAPPGPQSVDLPSANSPVDVPTSSQSIDPNPKFSADNNWTTRVDMSNGTRVGQPTICTDLGLQTTDCTDYEGLVNRLKSAWTAYTCPKQMLKGRSYGVTLVLDPRKSADVKEGEAKKDLSATLGAKPQDVVAKITKIARYMSATLTGAAFEIKPAGPVRLTVLKDREALWSWKVTPTEIGDDKPLQLVLSVHVGKDKDHTSEVQIQTLNEKIDVDVSLFEQLSGMAVTGNALLTFVLSIVTIVSGFVAWLNRSTIGTWLGLRAAPRRSETEKKSG